MSSPEKDRPDTPDHSEFLKVKIDPALGPSFSKVHDQILLKSLKEYLPQIYSLWQECSARCAEGVATEARLADSIVNLENQLREAELSGRAKDETIYSKDETIYSLEIRLAQSEADTREKAKLIDSLKTGLSESEADSRDKADEIHRLRSSLSWKVTAPLRRIYNLLKGI